jgi:UTP--glucose-1-phosphate uridylyltransferase
MTPPNSRAVRKAVILAAGFGTRFLPATKAVPKEMLPIFDTPVIQLIVEECLASGLDQIIMVTSGGKRAIEDHFDHQFELERALAEAGKQTYLDEVRRTAAIDLTFVRQKERLGNGHAVLTARHILEGEPFAIFFPDDVIFAETPAIAQLLEVYRRHGGTVLAVQRVPREQVSLYGVITPEPIAERTYRVHGVVEKPPADQAPSDLATVGRFVATPRLLDVLAETPPGRAGEIWLMDAFDRLRHLEPVYAYEYEGERFDCGQPAGLLKASLYAALRNEASGPELRAYLKSLDVG